MEWEVGLQKQGCLARRVGFCGLLFLCANVLKKLLAKLFSSHFYKATHYDKMQEALHKEFFMVALSQPREDREEDDPMKHKPSTLAELRTKSFAATGALVRCCSVTSSSGLLCALLWQSNMLLFRPSKQGTSLCPVIQ